MATELFTEQGYAATSLDAIVAGARVTKGALYHHFTGKHAIYEAVLERIESDAAMRVDAALTFLAALRSLADPGDRRSLIPG